MNLGLGNLYELKRHLLSESMRAQTNYDIRIAQIGRSVAGSFDKYCNRFFERAAGAKAEFSCERDHYYLPRYPVEDITLVEQRVTLSEGWIALPEGTILNRDDAIGLIQFGAAIGNWSARMRVTYTGGYWFETLEPADNGYPTAQPALAIALPDDVKLAWLLQCGRVWESMDKLGVTVAQEAAPGAPVVADLKLIPYVEQVLAGYKRYMLT